MAAPIPGVIAAAAKLGPVDSLLAAFNTNPYFIGMMMLILNLGGRFLAMEITKGQEQFLSHPFVRRGLIFVVLFIATRNIVIAFWLWLAIILSLGYLFNENSAFCVLGRGGVAGSKCATTGPTPPKPTDQELSIFKMLSEKVKTYEAFQNQADSIETSATTEQQPSSILAGVSAQTPVTQGDIIQPVGIQPVQSATITEPTNKVMLKKTLEQSELHQRIAAQQALGQVKLL
jgi:hypothetical protein